MAAPTASQRQPPYSRNHAPLSNSRTQTATRDGFSARGISPSSHPPPAIQSRLPGVPPSDRTPSLNPVTPSITVADRPLASRDNDRDSPPVSSSDRPSSQGRNSSKAVLTLALQKAHNAVVL